MINQVIKNIPTYISQITKEIYILGDEKYLIDYKGEKVTYKKIKKCEYENVDNSCVINNNKVFVFNDLGYKIIIIIPIEDTKQINDKKNILVADDSDLIIKFFKKIFEPEYNIIEAKNGLEAIDVISSDIKLDAIFVDLMMPISSGYQVLEYLDKSNLFKKVPVSIISGEDSKDGIDKAMKYNVIDMLQKPFSVDAAKSLLDKMLNR